MMALFFLFGGAFLAFIFGRNNFGNVFGSAVGTGILSFKTASFLTGLFLLLGSVFASSGTSETLLQLTHFDALSEAFYFSIVVAFVMMVLTRLGIPASVAQLSVGALVGWNLAFRIDIAWQNVIKIVWGWFLSPLISCFLAFAVFKITRWVLQKYPLPILYQDLLVKALWAIIGSFTAYSLGANNMPVLLIPFTQVVPESSCVLGICFSLMAGTGCLLASRKVIKTMTSKLFPLSSVESLIVGFSGALTLLLFSFQNGLFSALPVSISAAMIGAIVGVSFGKGGYGLKWGALCSIIFSWIWAPVFSGLLSFGFAFIILSGG